MVGNETAHIIKGRRPLGTGLLKSAGKNHEVQQPISKLPVYGGKKV